MPTTPLGYPVKENVIRDVLDTLRGVTLANGYSVNVTDTRRPEPVGVKTPVQGVMVEVSEESDVEKELQAHGYEDRDLTLRLTCTFNKSKSDTTPTDTMKNLTFAAIARALLQDPTCSDNAIWTYIGQAADRTDGEQGCVIDVRIHYRTVYGDPFNG